MRMGMIDYIVLEVAYALPEKQLIIPFKAPKNITVKEAIELSGILQEFKDIDLSHNKVGIFGKITALENTLRNKDRIEIYRPLIADPKEIRRKRAAEGRKTKKGT